jgi:hypothetical protein
MSELVGVLPARYFLNVTPSDSTRLTYETRGILLGVAGDIAIADVTGASVVISGLVAGIIHPISTFKIFSTGTTASDICVLW